MDNWNITQIADDLSTLLKLTEKYEVPIISDKLESLNATLPYSNEPKLNIELIEFHIDKSISGTNPFGINYITVFLENTCEFLPENIINNRDVIIGYSFQIDIEAFIDDNGPYLSCWHLDKNIESEPPKFTHPYYHFQFGGNTIEEQDAGKLVILGSPRLPHPPMDLFLGFHFIINNFFSSKDYDFVNKLLNNEDYQDIIKRAQNRMWQPYFKAFGTTTNLDYTLANVFPLYMQ